MKPKRQTFEIAVSPKTREEPPGREDRDGGRYSTSNIALRRGFNRRAVARWLLSRKGEWIAMRVAPLLLALLAVGCNFAPTDGLVCVPPATDPQHVEWIADGVQLWNDAGTSLRLELRDPTDDACDIDVRVASQSARGDRVGGHTDYDIGITPRVRIDFNYSGDRRPLGGDVPGYQAAAVAHELGHAMGADHSNDPQDLLYYELTYQRAVTAADLEQVQ